MSIFDYFKAVWQSWLSEHKLFESKPGVFVLVDDKITKNRSAKKLLDRMIKARFIYEVNPKEYKFVNHQINDSDFEYKSEYCSKCPHCNPARLRYWNQPAIPRRDFH